MSSSFIVLDNLRRHIHRGTRKTVVHCQAIEARRAIWGGYRINRAARTLNCSLVLRKNFGSTEIDKLDDTKVIEKNVYKKTSVRFT